jgi:hypothetical protein
LTVCSSGGGTSKQHESNNSSGDDTTNGTSGKTNGKEREATFITFLASLGIVPASNDFAGFVVEFGVVVNAISLE